MDGFMIARIAAAGLGMGLARGVIQWRKSRKLLASEQRDSSGGEDVAPDLRLLAHGGSGHAERSEALEQQGSRKLLPFLGPEER